MVRAVLEMTWEHFEHPGFTTLFVVGLMWLTEKPVDHIISHVAFTIQNS
jgi:hypothetical protein